MTIADIERLPAFVGTARQDLESLVEAARIVVLDPGQMVVTRKVRTSHYAFLLYGRWTTSRWLPGVADPHVTIEEGPGAWHGGFDTLDAVAPADVVCEVLSRVLFVPRPAMHGLFERSPALSRYMLAGYRAKLEAVCAHAEAGANGRAA